MMWEPAEACERCEDGNLDAKENYVPPIWMLAIFLEQGGGWWHQLSGKDRKREKVRERGREKEKLRKN